MSSLRSSQVKSSIEMLIEDTEKAVSSASMSHADAAVTLRGALGDGVELLNSLSRSALRRAAKCCGKHVSNRLPTGTGEMALEKSRQVLFNLKFLFPSTDRSHSKRDALQEEVNVIDETKHDDPSEEEMETELVRRELHS